MTGLLRAHLRAARGPLLTIAALIVALAASAVLAPVAVVGMLDASTRYRVETLSAPTRDLAVSGAFRADFALYQSPADEATTWAKWENALAQIRDEADAEVRRVFGAPQYLTRWGTPGEFTGTTYVVLDPHVADRIRIVEGRLPAPPADVEEWTTELSRVWDPMTGLPNGQAVDLPATEVVLSVASAADVGWEIGQTRTVGAEAGWVTDVPLTLVGTFEPADPADPYWLRTSGTAGADVGFNPDGVPYERVSAFAAPEALATLPSANPDGVQTDIWMPADPAAVTAGSAGSLEANLRAFVSRSHAVQVGQFQIAQLTFHTGSIDALERANVQNLSLVAVLGMLLSGPVGVALAVLVLACRMLWETRRAAFQLLAARGASSGQLRGLLVVDGLLVGVLPAIAGAVAGAAAAVALLPGASVTPAVAFAPIVLGILPAVVGAVTASGSRPGGRLDGRGPTAWRAVAELAIVVFAGLATALLIVRGHEATTGGIDPLAVAAPVLLALTACLATLRLYPLALRLVVRRARDRSGFVSLLGAARALRDPAVGAAPVLALVVGVSFAVAGGVLLSIVQQGAHQTASVEAGADLQVQALRIPSDAAARIGEIEGVAVAAGIDVVPATELSIDNVRSRVSLYVADIAELTSAQEGFPTTVPAGVDLGDGTGEPRVFTSDAVAERGLRDPDAAVQLGMADVEFAGSVPGVAAFANGPMWALIDRGSLAQITERPHTTARVLVRLDADADVAAVRAQISEIVGGGVRIVTADDVRDRIEDDPAVRGLRLVLLSGIAASAALSAIAVVITLVLGARARRRILALLHTLGAPPRAGRALLAWELAPVSIAALVVGAAFGAVLPLLLATVIDLRAFTAGPVAPAYAIDPLLLGATLGGFVGVAALVAFLALVVARRARAAAVLRTVEDT
jgi:putative ABC transport system permease protein